MHRWTCVDRLLLRVAPTVSFFLLAALFEEMTLFVPIVEDRTHPLYGGNKVRKLASGGG